MEKYYDPNDNFWLCLKTLKEFYSRNKCFPLEGRIPDFHSETEMYIRIKNAYSEKASQDRESFRQILKEVAGEKEKTISEEYLKQFTSNWMGIYIQGYRTLTQEFEALNQEFVWDMNDVNKWYFCIRAADEFYEEENRYPNPSDLDQIKEKISELLKRYSIDQDNFQVEQKYIEEMYFKFNCRCRAEDSKLITTASILGGIASQEIIKVVTKQFIPINNTFLFEGNRSIGAMTEF